MHTPLALTAFEEYMLRDDRAAHPMSFFVRMRFSGCLDRSELDSAWRTALARHPLLSSTVQQPVRGRPRWTDHPPSSAVSWLAAEPRVSPLDLRSEPGVRAWAVPHAGTTDLWTQFHHACCDGLGAWAFLEDLLLAYAIKAGTTTAAVVLPPRRAERLRGRGRFGLSAGKWLRILHQQAVGLLGVWQFLRHTPVPLVPQTPQDVSQPLDDAYPAVCAAELSDRQSRALRDFARAEGVTLNDLLVRDLVLSLSSWRSRHAPGLPSDWLRLAVPMNLRTAADTDLPAANVVSMVFIDRRPGDAADPTGLLAGIHAQMDQIKRLRLGLTFVLSLSAARLLPGGIAGTLEPARCTATAVLTNLGELLKGLPVARQEGRLVLGDAVLETIDLFGPLRPYTSATFAVFTYAGRLRATLHYDPRAITSDQAQELLDAFLDRLHASASKTRKPGSNLNSKLCRDSSSRQPLVSESTAAKFRV